VHIPPERAHWDGEKPAGDMPVGLEAVHETVPVGTLPFVLATAAVHWVLKPTPTEEGLQEMENPSWVCVEVVVEDPV